ncbi:MAG: insulinase family protein [Eubacterium sp.]|jgi:predicted Zn-dependent peptidase|nr:insulinase family protein [Eubacterium sp.]
MTREIIKSARLNEEYIRIKHDSGLTVCLYPMKGFSTTYALFGAKYGSVDTTFKQRGDKNFVTVPAGIAHYLEHKLFENEDSPVFDLFSKTGASANAFTSFDKTAYLFSCSQKTEENLEILLKFVQEPYFTDENVQKEQGIISQEIKMYNDDPEWCVFFNGLNALYHNNPVRIDIAGTVESIAEINKELLYRCYETFYNLNNMCLCIAGNINVDNALAVCDKMLKPAADKGLCAIVPDEPQEVKHKETVNKMPCSIPLFMILFKFPNFTKRENIENYIRYSILFETLLGSTSAFYNKMYKSGLINDSFDVGVFNGRGFFAPIIQGESNEPRKLYDEIKRAILEAKDNGVPEIEFLNVKKKIYGQFLMMFGSADAVASGMLDAQFSDISIYDMIDITAQATLEDITLSLNKIDAENSVISIIEPLIPEEI